LAILFIALWFTCSQLLAILFMAFGLPGPSFSLSFKQDSQYLGASKPKGYKQDSQNLGASKPKGYKQDSQNLGASKPKGYKQV
jgi:hypothetical protein